MRQNVSTLYYLKKGDFVELHVFHNDGNLSIDVSQFGNRSPEFMMHWVGPYDVPESENGAS